MNAREGFLTTMRCAGTSAVAPEQAELVDVSHSFMAGEVIAGRYELISLRAAGGMGCIWNAQDRIQSRSVAVKLCHARDRWPAASLNELLLREAAFAKRLTHPGIVEVLEMGSVPGREAYVVFELLEGESFRSLLNREGNLSASEAIRVLLPVLHALGHAHTHGIVHHDVKPENIVLARLRDGGVQPKLVDFGLAKRIGERPTELFEMVAGSPGYVSPEQADPRYPPDPRSDIWAFAVVLYEAIAGRKPWHARTWPTLIHAINTSPPRSLLHQRGVDRELWRILCRGLASRAHARWSTSRAFAAALDEWLLAHDSAEPSVGCDGAEDPSAAPTLCATRRSLSRPDATSPPVTRCPPSWSQLTARRAFAWAGSLSCGSSLSATNPSRTRPLLRIGAHEPVCVRVI